MVIEQVFGFWKIGVYDDHFKKSFKTNRGRKKRIAGKISIIIRQVEEDVGKVIEKIDMQKEDSQDVMSEINDTAVLSMK